MEISRRRLIVLGAAGLMSGGIAAAPAAHATAAPTQPGTDLATPGPLQSSGEQADSGGPLGCPMGKGE